jgi:hypothetical protein
MVAFAPQTKGKNHAGCALLSLPTLVKEKNQTKVKKTRKGKEKLRCWWCSHTPCKYGRDNVNLNAGTHDGGVHTRSVSTGG